MVLRLTPYCCASSTTESSFARTFRINSSRMLTRDLLGQGTARGCLGGLKVQPPPDEHGVTHVLSRKCYPCPEPGQEVTPGSLRQDRTRRSSQTPVVVLAVVALPSRCRSPSWPSRACGRGAGGHGAGSRGGYSTSPRPFSHLPSATCDSPTCRAAWWTFPKARNATIRLVAFSMSAKEVASCSTTHACSRSENIEALAPNSRQASSAYSRMIFSRSPDARVASSGTTIGTTARRVCGKADLVIVHTYNCVEDEDSNASWASGKSAGTSSMRTH